MAALLQGTMQRCLARFASFFSRSLPSSGLMTESSSAQPVSALWRYYCSMRHNLSANRCSCIDLYNELCPLVVLSSSCRAPSFSKVVTTATEIGRPVVMVLDVGLAWEIITDLSLTWHNGKRCGSTLLALCSSSFGCPGGSTEAILAHLIALAW